MTTADLHLPNARTSRLLAAAVCAALSMSLAPRPAPAAMPALIPRDVLFGNPERTAAQISPDGTMLVYLAPSQGVLSVWVRTIGKSDDRVVARDPARPIRSAQFSPDGSAVIFSQDKGGD